MQKYVKENILSILGLIISFLGITVKDLIYNFNQFNMISIGLGTFIQAVIISGLVGFLIWHFEGLIEKLNKKIETQNQKLELQNKKNEEEINNICEETWI